jgi:uncharacterized protein (TIGR02145 family)
LDPIVNNIVTVKDSLNSNLYTLTLEKDGYVTYNHVFTIDSLNLFNCERHHLPLVVELERNCNCNVSDIDDNVYRTVKIGTQCWMVENLKVTHYRNGDPITRGFLFPYDPYYHGWGYYTQYFDYNDDPSISAIYGRLYGWTVVRDSRKIAPVGWRVATDDDWHTLATFVNYNAGKLKESGTAHWPSPNTATNETGFTAIPNGYVINVSPILLGTTAVWWAPQVLTPNNSWGWWMGNTSSVRTSKMRIVESVV